MKLRPLALSAALLLIAPPTAALATGTHDAYNRRASAIAVVPNGQAKKAWTVHAVWTAELFGPAATTLLLDTDVVLVKNGVEADRETVKVVAFAGSGGCGSCQPGCGQGATNGMAAALLCLSDGPAGCSCQFPPLTSSFHLDLVPGDDLEIVLKAAPGALPETKGGDDVVRHTYTGKPAFWDRQLIGAEWVPSTASPSGFDLRIEWKIAASGIANSVMIDPVFEVASGQSVVGPFELACGPWLLAPNLCGTSGFCSGDTCAWITCGSLGSIHLGCDPYLAPNGLTGCACQSDSQYLQIPGNGFDPTKDVAVFLKSAPGALPELPGFEGNDMFAGCLAAAADASYGKGKTGTHGLPDLAGATLPILGQPTKIALTNAFPGAFPLLLLGLAPAGLPFDGGTILVNPQFVLPIPLAIGLDGTLTLEGMLPNEPSLCGVKLYHQMLFKDPGAAGAQHFAMTNGLLRTLGQ
jgi:hypothetical protein